MLQFHSVENVVYLETFKYVDVVYCLFGLIVSDNIHTQRTFNRQRQKTFCVYLFFGMFTYV